MHVCTHPSINRTKGSKVPPSQLFKGQNLQPTSNDSFFAHVINIYMPLTCIRSSVLPFAQLVGIQKQAHVCTLSCPWSLTFRNRYSQTCPRYSLQPGQGIPLFLVSLKALSPPVHDHRSKLNTLLMISLTVWKGRCGFMQHLLGLTIK